jgi:hypothetical protein
MTKQLKKSLKATKESRKSVIQNFECKYCGTKFHKEGTLTTHMCVKKRRHMEIDSQASRFGFRTFQRFYDITMASKKPKTIQEFIDSSYYIDFVKFGNHLANLKPVYPDKFIDFVLKNGVKLKDWTRDFVYDTYIEDLVKKEPADAAIERTLGEIIEWTTSNNTQFSAFFSDISANEAAHMIRTGKISPWVLYLCDSGGNLMAKFNDDHAKIIGNIIDASFWKKRFKNNEDDVDYTTALLGQAGL